VTLDDYTPDAICRAMGLPGFVEPAWLKQRDRIMRVLLKPAFHPEVCVTIYGAAARWSAVTFDKSGFWHSSPGALLTTWRETGRVLQDDCDRLIDLFRSTQNQLQPDKRYICCDGMEIDACLVSDGGAISLKGNVGANGGIDNFARAVVETCRDASTRSEIRNAFSSALCYVSGALPPKESEASNCLPVVKLAVLGDPAERAELLSAIEKKTGGAFGSPKP